MNHFFIPITICVFALSRMTSATDLIGGEAPKMLSPTEAVESFTLPEGFQVNAWASEESAPLRSPTAMTFDSQGRLWVTNCPSHPHAKPNVKPRDSIVVLEDTDRDGVADKSTVFYDELYLPMGIAVADGGKTVYVVSEPNLMKLTDSDGDLKADKVEIMMHGFGSEDNHHFISGFQWGPDGRLYFGQGLFLNTQVETPLGPVRAYQGTIFKLDPRVHRLQVESGYNYSNPWGIVFGKWGQPFVADASPASNYYLPHLSSRFDYPKTNQFGDFISKHEGSLSFTPSGRRPSCGNEFLAHEHWPEAVRGAYTTNQMKGWHGVRWYDLKEKGSGYTSEPVSKNDSGEIVELMSSSDTTFRPVAQQIGPDGALYVLDYYNPIVGHTTYSFRDPRRIQTHGRVWRITAKDRPTPWQPEIRTAKNAELLDLLLSPNERWGYHARRELQQRDKKKVLADVDAWQSKHREDDHAATEVLWMYRNFNDPQPVRLGRLLLSKNVDARVAAVQILRDWQLTLPESKTLPMLEVALVDPHPRVRLEAMVAAGFHPNSGAAIQLATKALDLEMDAGMELATRETLNWLSKNVASVPSEVANFLIPSLTDAELLTSPPTIEHATEILTRSNISAEEKRSALRILGQPNGRESLNQLFFMLNNSEMNRAISEGKIEKLLLSWDLSLLEKNAASIQNLAAGTTIQSIRTAALAVLLRQGAKPEATVEAISDNQWIAAMPLAGRGNIDPTWHPIVLKNLAKSGGEGQQAIRAASLFPSQDLGSAEALVQIVNENREQNLPLAFTALDALQQIPAETKPGSAKSLVLTKIRISATGDLRFKPDSFRIPTGSAVELTFYNPDNLYHNLAIVELDAVEQIGLAADQMAGTPDGLKKNYIPENEAILHATPQLSIGGKRTHVLRFFAPEESGEYAFICTYPGHWRAMRGSMIVAPE